jgi:hypothetical protein
MIKFNFLEILFSKTRSVLTSDQIAIGFGLPTSDFRLRTSDFGLRTSDFRLRTSDFGLRTSDFRLIGYKYFKGLL